MSLAMGNRRRAGPAGSPCRLVKTTIQEVEMKGSIFGWLVLVLVGWASTAAAVEVAGDVYLGVAGKYLWRGFDLSGGKAVMQGGGDLSAYGITLGVWSNMQLGDGDGDAQQGGEVTETDFTLDYTVGLGEFASLSFGNLHYSYNEPGADDELYAGVAFDVVLAPEFYVYYAWDIEDAGGMDGLFYTLGVRHEFEVSDRLTIGLAGLVGINQENPLVGEYRGLHHVELTFSADYALDEQWSLSAGLLCSGALSDEAEDEGVEDEFVPTLSMTFAY